VSNNCPNLKTGKWSVEDSVKVVESKLAFREIMGFHQQGRSGFGLSKPLVISPKGTHNYRIFISDLSEDIERENYLATKQLNSIYKEIGLGGVTMSRWICHGSPYLLWYINGKKWKIILHFAGFFLSWAGTLLAPPCDLLKVDGPPFDFELIYTTPISCLSYNTISKSWAVTLYILCLCHLFQ